MRWVFVFSFVILMLASARFSMAQEPVEDLQALENRAAQNDVSAMVELGTRYQNGTGVPVDLQKAERWYGSAAARGDINGNYFLANILLYRGAEDDHRRARQLLRRALRLCENEQNKATCNPLHILNYLAVAERELAMYGDALKSAERVAELASAAADEFMVALANEEMGMNYQLMGLPGEAMHRYVTARTIYEKLQGKNSAAVGNVLLNMGNTLEAMSRHEESIAAYRQALAILETAPGNNALSIAYLHVNIGWSLAQIPRYDEAYAESEHGLELLRQSSSPVMDRVGYVLNNMGIIRERQGRHAEAITLNLRSLVIYERFADISLAPKRWALRSLSKSYASLGQKDKAILFAKMAVNTHQQIREKNSGLDQSRSSALTEAWRGLYQDLADLLISEGRIAEAQNVLDMLKQQELIEFVRRDSSAGTESGNAGLTKRESVASDKLQDSMKGAMAIANELDTLNARRNAGELNAVDEARISDLETELDKSYEEFISGVDTLLAESNTESANVQDEIAALNLDYAADRQELLREMPRPTVLLQAASLEGSLHLFLTTKDVSVHRQVPIPRTDLSRKIFEALTAIEARDPGADVKLAELYDLLVMPIASDLEASKAEVIMLNLGGFLRYLPFAALKSENGYLIEDYAIVIDTPSARTKFETVDRSDAEAAGFGVTAAHPGFSPLPGVARELEAIFEGSDASGELGGAPVLDQSFTADSLKEALKKRPKLLHVASHFKFVPGNETDSFLLLGNGDALTLEQIRKGRGFRFGGVDLLTLSACETAKGGGAEGDEVESFGAIAQMNGASAVMATLWPIADDASGKLMADFYKGLVQDGLDKADALRRAQIAMLRDIPMASVNLTERGATSVEEDGEKQEQGEVTTRHPYYWSPYILMGNWL
jgi:CHAT domain-containing protein